MSVLERQVTLASGEQGVVYQPTGTLRGAVVILHERYGLVQHTLDLARKLAESGYGPWLPICFPIGKVTKRLLSAERSASS
ncbi:MAG: dienelactone hydrolase family protein [Alicyclobacillus sp.]|nr:dienelactone hydrolase family protein [Alicyclobacillus sp.]